MTDDVCQLGSSHNICFRHCVYSTFLAARRQKFNSTNIVTFISDEYIFFFTLNSTSLIIYFLAIQKILIMAFHWNIRLWQRPTASLYDNLYLFNYIHNFTITFVMWVEPGTSFLAINYNRSQYRCQDSYPQPRSN